MVATLAREVARGGASLDQFAIRGDGVSLKTLAFLVLPELSDEALQDRR